MPNFSTDYVKSDHHKAVNQAPYSVESLEHHRSKVEISVFENSLKWSLFERISCFGVLGSLKHTRPPYKGPVNVT